MHKLFVFLRSDLDSMTPGKAAAQVAHAASQAAQFARNMRDDEKQNGYVEAYENWEMQPAHEVENYTDPNIMGFGTTIVLDGGSFGDPVPVPYVMMNGVIRDPSYPLRDGSFTHLINIVTCYWVFEDPDTNPGFVDWLSGFRLYNGNNRIAP